MGRMIWIIVGGVAAASLIVLLLGPSLDGFVTQGDGSGQRLIYLLLLLVLWGGGVIAFIRERPGQAFGSLALWGLIIIGLMLVFRLFGYA